jgi:hypothetical protein
MLDEQQIKNLIKVWFEKATGETDHFSKFVFLWICFNAWLDYRSGKETDRAMINWLISQSRENSDLVRIFNTQKNVKRFNEALKILASHSPINDSRNRRPSIDIKDENDFENIVRGIYRIRCNLFHGGTEAHKSEDLKLIVIANEILLRWVGGLLVSWERGA